MNHSVLTVQFPSNKLHFAVQPQAGDSAGSFCHPLHTTEAAQKVLVGVLSINLLCPRALDDLLSQAGEKGRSCSLCCLRPSGRSCLQVLVGL